MRVETGKSRRLALRLSHWLERSVAEAPAPAPEAEESLELVEPTPSERPRRQHTPALSAQWLLEGPGWPVLALAVDLLMLALAVLSAVVGANAAGVPLDAQTWLYVFPFAAILMLYLRGMYRRRIRIAILDWLAPVIGAISVAAMMIIALIALADPAASPGGLVGRGWLFGAVYVGAGRVLLASSQRRARSRRSIGKPTLIIGAGIVGAQVARRLECQPEYGLRPIGYLDADPSPNVLAADRRRAAFHASDGTLPPDVPTERRNPAMRSRGSGPTMLVSDRRMPVLGGPGDLAAVIEETGAEHVILAFSAAPDRGLIPLVRQCEELGLQVSLVPRLFESINARVALEHLGGLPLLGLRAVDPKGWQFAVKYLLDRAAAAVSLALVSPIMVAAAVAVRLSSPGPIFFRQRRVGRDGQPFDLLKFRSMREPEEPQGYFAPESGHAPGGVEGVDRRTPVGRVLRRTSIDELPQLINVLRGEMSLVGPRPERPEYVELFLRDVDRYSDRHRVKAGITGWAQVHGLRGQTSLADRVEWDNFYIENWSLWLDFKIVMLTIVEIFRTSDDA